MKKKYLYNQKNKEELIEILENENFKRSTVSFYKYVELNNLENLRDHLFISWNKLNILGRVYIAKEGINATISGKSADLKLTSAKIKKYLILKNLIAKIYQKANSNHFIDLR